MSADRSDQLHQNRATAVATPLAQASGLLRVATGGPGCTEISADVARWLREVEAGGGIVHLLIRHTSASLMIQENADPDVQHDLVAALRRLAPEGPHYRHDSEGPDDMPAHIKAALTQTSIGIPVASGRLLLGTWQGLYLFEHRARPHRREVVLHLGP